MIVIEMYLNSHSILTIGLMVNVFHGLSHITIIAKFLEVIFIKLPPNLDVIMADLSNV